MKIQCDVCDKEEASVFCTADEAALCEGCDTKVHHANKLASKHHRFSLLHHGFKDAPPCDICQERRAFLFCKEDRAILCRECDITIHKANEHTQKHNRFLLTGVKLSASSSSYQTSSSSNGYLNGGIIEAETGAQSSVSHEVFNQSSNEPILQSTSTPYEVDDNLVIQQGSDSMATSSMSEYLMETLPGWHIDEFLDPSCPPYGFSKTDNHKWQYKGSTP